MENSFIYILTNDKHTVLYTGSTTNLKKRISHHKHRLIGGFTKKYNVHKLVYFETHADKTSAMKRERQIKDISRKKKIELIESINKNWNELYNQL